jgi:hypothetical protein
MIGKVIRSGEVRREARGNSNAFVIKFASMTPKRAARIVSGFEEETVNSTRFAR